MSTVRAHLRQANEDGAAKEIVMAKGFAAAAASHRKFQEAATDDATAEEHGRIADAYTKMSKASEDRCAAHVNAAKSLDEQSDKALGDRDMSKIIQDDILGTIPCDVPLGVTAVSRYGQPIMNASKNIPTEFRKLAEIEG